MTRCLAHMRRGTATLSERLGELGRYVLSGRRLTRQEALELVGLGCRSPHDLLYWANRTRTARFGNAVGLCRIVPGKLGGCGEDCKWCAQSVRAGGRRGTAATPRAKRTPMADILRAARSAAACGAACIGIVNSGRRPSPRDLHDVIAATAKIKADLNSRGIHVCASLGEVTDDQAARLAEAGIVRYNHNLETSRRFFPKVVTTHTYEDRLATLQALRRAGIELCCGGLFGMGETWEDRIDLALTLREQVRPNTIPLNFLHPISGTALATVKPMPPIEILTTIALFRLLLPDTDLRLAGGRAANLRHLQSWAFYAGATSTIAGKLLTTTGPPVEEDLQMIADLGLQVVNDLPPVPPARRRG